MRVGEHTKSIESERNPASRDLDGRDLEAGGPLRREVQHGQPVFGRCQAATLVWRDGARHQEHAIRLEHRSKACGGVQMAEVHRVERAAQDPDQRSFSSSATVEVRSRARADTTSRIRFWIPSPVTAEMMW